MYHQLLFVIISILIYNPNSETKCLRGGILVIREIMPNALLKLLVKDKPLYSRKVPVSVKGCQTRPPSTRETRRLTAEIQRKITADKHQPARKS